MTWRPRLRLRHDQRCSNCHTPPTDRQLGPLNLGLSRSPHHSPALAATSRRTALAPRSPPANPRHLLAHRRQHPPVVHVPADRVHQRRHQQHRPPGRDRLLHCLHPTPLRVRQPASCLDRRQELRPRAVVGQAGITRATARLSPASAPHRSAARTSAYPRLTPRRQRRLHFDSG